MNMIAKTNGGRPVQPLVIGGPDCPCHPFNHPRRHDKFMEAAIEAIIDARLGADGVIVNRDPGDEN